MNIRVIVSVLALLTAGVFAAGPSLSEDRTRCEAPHLLVTLNGGQLEEVTVLAELGEISAAAKRDFRVFWLPIQWDE